MEVASSEPTRRLLRDRIEMQRAKIEQEQQWMKELEREKERAKVLYVVNRPFVRMQSSMSTVS
jgi:hypothetical protein